MMFQFNFLLNPIGSQGLTSDESSERLNESMSAPNEPSEEAMA